MFPCKASKQWRIVEIQLLASVGWKWGYQAFSCPRSLNVTHCRKEICSTSLSKGIQFLPEDWGRWERQHAPSALHDGCIMLAKDRVEVSKIWITGHWLWSRLSYIPDCCKSMKNCRDSAFSLRGLEAGLWAFRVQMLATCDDMLFFGIHSRHSFLKFQASTPYQKLEVPESRSTLLQFCIVVASCPSLRCSCRKKRVSCREEGLVTELWYGRFVTIYWLCSQLCYVAAANQRTIVEIELLATVSWTCGCQPLSCRCLQNVMHCRKEMCCTCLFKESMPFVKSKPPLPTRRLSFLRAAVRSTSPAVWSYHAHAFLAAAEKKQSHAEKQRVWPRSCRIQDLLRTIQWLCPRFGLRVFDCALRCDMWLWQSNKQLSKLSF